MNFLFKNYLKAWILPLDSYQKTYLPFSARVKNKLLEKYILNYSVPLPLIITENGLADSEDMLRPIYLSSHLYQLLRALKTGVDVKGYLYWAVTDNYEWSSGYKIRFGLAKVDYKTKKRILRPSSLIFKEIAENKELPFDM
ncbi:MAG: family 1 glycosylhydrolase [Nitrososphaeria archaeon]